MSSPLTLPALNDRVTDTWYPEVGEGLVVRSKSIVVVRYEVWIHGGLIPAVLQAGKVTDDGRWVMVTYDLPHAKRYLRTVPNNDELTL